METLYSPVETFGVSLKKKKKKKANQAFLKLIKRDI